MVYINMFIAGFLNFISPCILPIVPLLVGYLFGEGIKAEDQEANETKGKKLNKLVNKKLLAFIFGFSLIFVLLGVLANSLGIFINKNISDINFIAGIFIILMGINYTGIINIGFLNKEFKIESKNSKGKDINILDSLIMGIFFALSWGPCAGPYLATALSTAANRKNYNRRWDNVIYLFNGNSNTTLYSRNFNI